MNIRLLSIFAILTFCIMTPLKGQDNRQGPLFPEIDKWHDINIDRAQVDFLRTVDQPKDQPCQFALAMPVVLKPGTSGFIMKTPEETVWVMPVTSPGAFSLNVILEPFDLPEGAKVFVYDQNHSVVRGAITSKDDNGYGSLPVLPVPGDRLVVECHFPGGVIPEGSVGVSQVAHDFAGYFLLAGTKDKYYGRSGACEVDISCTADVNYLTSARSVCRLVIRGTELCSGVLVNNTGQDVKPYLLTAQHCIQDNSDANNTIFLFNYQSPWCDGPDNTSGHTITGATLRATNDNIDFTLLELSSYPSLVFRPFFAGWDVTTTTPSSTYAIHHPEGDVMKLSRDSDAPVSSSFPVGDFISGGFWKIVRWDMGSTESGSSGCPLFDQNNRLRGTLTGGSATCLIPEADYFAKVSRMFNISTLPGENLRTWLDPAVSGVNFFNGLDPYAANMSASDTLSNMPVDDPGTSDVYTAPDYGYSTGTNSDSIIAYAEYIPFSGTGEIAWVHLNIAAASFLSAADTVRVFIWNDGPVPGTVLASRMVRIESAKNNYDLEVDFGRTISVSGPYYIGYRVYYRNPVSSSQSQFAVKHSGQYAESNMNTAWFKEENEWKPFTLHPSFPMAVSLHVNAIMVENSIPDAVADTPVEPEIFAFPNPFSSTISFRCDTRSAKTSLALFNNNGQQVFSSEYFAVFPGTLDINLSFLRTGIYHYMLRNDNHIHTGTIIKATDR